MNADPNASPFLDVPRTVVALAAVIGGVEGMFSLAQAGYLGGDGGICWRINAISDFCFSGEILDWMITTGQFPLEHLRRFVTYPFLHLSFTHVLFSVVFILAIGKAISGAFGGWRLLAVFFGASIFGAFVYGYLFEFLTPLIGSYPGIYGLIGAFTFLLWVRARVLGEAPMKAFSLIGFLLGIQLLFAALFGSTGDWVADLAGFVAGFGMSFFLIPGGWTRLRDSLRG